MLSMWFNKKKIKVYKVEFDTFIEKKQQILNRL